MASADRRVTQVGLLLMVPPNELCQQSDAAHRGVPSGHHPGLRVRILATLVVLSKSRMGVLLMVPSAQVGVLATLVVLSSSVGVSTSVVLSSSVVVRSCVVGADLILVELI